METLAALAASPLFEMLSNQELQAISALAREKTVSPGDVVLEEGELGSSLYVLIGGEVEIQRRDSGGRVRNLVTLRPPEFFGEMGLVDRDYRSATVRAVTETRLLEITPEALTQFRQSFRDGYTYLVMNIARVLSARLRDATDKLLQAS